MIFKLAFIMSGMMITFNDSFAICESRPGLKHPLVFPILILALHIMASNNIQVHLSWFDFAYQGIKN